MSEEIAKCETFNLVPRSLGEAIEYAKLIASTEIVPQSYRGKPGDVLIAVQMGAELGVSPLQSLQNIAVINGRPTMWGDMVIGLVQASGLLESMDESWDAAKGEASCTVLRKGRPGPVTRTFGLADAKRAKLDAKQTYQQYPQRMCQMRARSWALRDEFADVLKGLAVREEVEDYPTPRTVRMPEPLKLAEKVDEFIAADPAPAQSASAKPVAPAAAQRADGPSWEGAIESVREKSGERNGKPWTVYFIHGAGEFMASTFDTNLADVAKMFVGTGELVRVDYTIGPKGNTATGIVAVNQPEEEIA